MPFSNPIASWVYMERGNTPDLTGYSVEQLLRLLAAVTAEIVLRCRAQPEINAASEVNREQFTCIQECVYCGRPCCRIEPQHRHHKCQAHLQWR